MFARYCYFIAKAMRLRKGVQKMKYEKPVTLAQGTERMADCRPNSKPSGRPCDPPRPHGHGH